MTVWNYIVNILLIVTFCFIIVLTLLCAICKIKEMAKQSWGSGNLTKHVNITHYASEIPSMECPRKVLQISMTKYTHVIDDMFFK